MKITLDQLTDNFIKQNPLPWLILISGGEVLLNQESLDLIRKILQKQGFIQRNRFDQGHNLDWQAVKNDSIGLSLFADKKITEIHNENKTLDKEAVNFLSSMQKNPPKDLKILLFYPNLEKFTDKSWYKSLFSKENWHIHHNQLNQNQFNQQIQKRLQKYSLNFSKNAVDELISHCDGNLLAAEQIINRIAISSDKADDDLLMANLADLAQFSAQQFRENFLEQNYLKAYRIAEKLEKEDKYIIALINWHIQQIAINLLAIKNNQPSALPLFMQEKYRKSAKNYSLKAIKQLFTLSSKIDKLSKGTIKGDAWLTLKQFLLLKATHLIKNKKF